jgi:hypothetical protein
MTTFILGTGRCAFTVGVAPCPQRGTPLPFFAFADADKAAAELDMTQPSEMRETDEEVRKTIEVFDRHGMVIYLDNYEATERFLGMVMTLINHAVETSWVSRDMERETIQ